MGGGGSTPRSGRLYPRERPGTHFRGGWVGPRAGLEGRKISLPAGFDPRTVQPVVSRYTDWAIAAHSAVAPRYKILIRNMKKRLKILKVEEGV